MGVLIIDQDSHAFGAGDYRESFTRPAVNGYWPKLKFPPGIPGIPGCWVGGLILLRCASAAFLSPRTSYSAAICWRRASAGLAPPKLNCGAAGGFSSRFLAAAAN